MMIGDKPKVNDHPDDGILGNEPEDEDHQWPITQEDESADNSFEEEGHGRHLAEGNCGIFADGHYFHPTEGKCYNLGGNWWNDKITYIRASDDTCIDVWEHHEGGRHRRVCGPDWKQLSGLSRQVSRVCCPPRQSRASNTSPLAGGCNGNGGACGCGHGGDGKQISMNRYYGDWNDEKVNGCGGAFRLDGASLNSQWGGSLSASGSPEANVAHEIGLSFFQDKSYVGWEGCCYICGANLQLAGKISDGWYCEKDFFSTGIWLKGKNK